MIKSPITKRRSYFYALSLIFSEAEYNIIDKPLLHVHKPNTFTFLPFIFDDSAEDVWIAAMGISSTDMEDIINTVKDTIHKTLDIPVHVNGVLIQPTDKPKQTKTVSQAQSQKDIHANTTDSYILIFQSIAEAAEYFQNNTNPIQEDITHLPDAISYYEKIVNYLNLTPCVSSTAN